MAETFDFNMDERAEYEEYLLRVHKYIMIYKICNIAFRGNNYYILNTFLLGVRLARERVYVKRGVANLNINRVRVYFTELRNIYK